MPPMFHASDAANRDSISAHGLDWHRMGGTPGIAGSPTPEVEGIFLTGTLEEARFLVRLRADIAVRPGWAPGRPGRRYLADAVP